MEIGLRKITSSPLLLWSSVGLFAAFILLFTLRSNDPILISVPEVSSQLDNSKQVNIEPSNANVRTLRVIRVTNNNKYLSNRIEKELLETYAQSTGHTLEWVTVSSASKALQKLRANEADLIASIDGDGLKEVGETILLTMPFANSKQQVVGRANSNVNDATVNLTVREVAVKRSSPSWDELSVLARDYKSMELLLIPDEMSVELILSRVNTGQYDLAVIDSLELPDDLEFRYNLEIVLDISDESFLSWGVGKDNSDLQISLNQFLSKKGLESEIAKSYKDDFPHIKNRKLLRVITYQSPVNYYYDNGRLKGFEYDLVNKFAERHGLRLDVVVADSQAKMLELLKEGKGDIIAASVPGSAYSKRKYIKFSDAYNYASPVLIGRSDEEILDVKDLEGRTIHLSAESPYKNMLLDLKARSGIKFSINQSDTGANAEVLLYRIAQNKNDLTVLGSHEVKAELSRQVNLKALVNLGEPGSLNWIIRDTNTQLLSAVNEHLGQEYRKGFYNVIHARYIDKPDARISKSSLLAGTDQLSPYDEIVHKYADMYGFDWRLIIAQMYQESQFNPQAVSDAGAEGLMQILPQTAEMVGVKNLRDPDANIKGGLSYMHHIHNLLEDSLTIEDRTWLTLASYNAGYRRVKRARSLAEVMGLNKNVWFNNVEIAMLRLAIPRVLNGYTIRECKCGQTVVYVREIRSLYNNYLRLTQSMKAASSLDVRVDES